MGKMGHLSDGELILIREIAPPFAVMTGGDELQSAESIAGKGGSRRWVAGIVMAGDQRDDVHHEEPDQGQPFLSG